jgi:hypothetical protein
MDSPVVHEPQHELREKRQELHGKRRKLHEQLSAVCENFALDGLSREHKKAALIRELQYLADYYRDEQSWKDIE